MVLCLRHEKGCLDDFQQQETAFDSYQVLPMLLLLLLSLYGAVMLLYLLSRAASKPRN
jgi:hypothetical protein